MYLQQRVIVIVVMALVISIGITKGQTICNISLEDALKCKSSMTPPNPTPPSKDCCDVVSHADLPCLCPYKNSPLLPSLGIDPNLALQLPAKCNIPNPPKC
uniref:Bifunctional inhibitor/plant lipid transfer protein/seed storage helical domain-containing protein n=1 Tax=Cajanus cajan TaxID=3821 RepID=A0A151QT21_CAJCA|nr:hypothetical protein KK1_045738 [Cajanus cajan]